MVGDDELVLGDGLPVRGGGSMPADAVIDRTAELPASRRRWRGSLGRPRLSTVLLVSGWVALFVLYLEVRPGG
ncbi:hypothetical protein [Nocardia terpenica]|uniref:Uncharacterized protein n=1 Tax=Nocardia terpenica TaxID=455432 RepID=A0A291RRZ6_9NOCA|nr:hypothetical protein [Nocardia terpenica]ATL70029.1 hypothetical protein CRH09_31440 [Nocardia terpenica]